MKLTKILPAFLCVTAGLLASCSSDDPTDPGPGPNEPGELVLVAIDTAKVITMDGNGANPAIVLDRLQNSSSYFSGLAISPEGDRIAYGDYQTLSFSPDVVSTRQIRVAAIDGTGDNAAYTADNTNVSFGAIRYLSGNKIFFVEETYWPDATRKLQIVNTDGTGLQTLSGQYDAADITGDLAYLLLDPVAAANGPRVQIIDRTGDNGAGSLYHNEMFDGVGEYAVGHGVFTTDGKLAVIPYADGDEIKVRIISMDTKTSSDMTIVSGLSGGWISYRVAMASDSNRGVLTVTGEGYARSRSYVFNLTEATIATPFENNDENVLDVYIH